MNIDKESDVKKFATNKQIEELGLIKVRCIHNKSNIDDSKCCKVYICFDINIYCSRINFVTWNYYIINSKHLIKVKDND